MTPDEVQPLIDPVTSLWNNGHSTVNGQNDRVPLHEAYEINDSLRLIQVDLLELNVSQPGRDFGNFRRSVQGRFRYGGMDYWLRVTDPVYERQYLQQAEGRYQMGRSCLTVSLGEPYRGYTYKLIAGIIRL